MWNRGINSDAALRLAKPGAGPGLNIPGTRGALAGRGGSVDRSRGRARGSYHYSRGLSYEDTENSNGYNSRGMRSYDRSSVSVYIRTLQIITMTVYHIHLFCV